MDPMFFVVVHFALGIQSPKLRMLSWNLITFRFGGDYTPQQSSSDKVIGSLGLGIPPQKKAFQLN